VTDLEDETVDEGGDDASSHAVDDHGDAGAEEEYDDEGYDGEPRRRRWAVVAIAVLVLAAVGLGLGLALSGGSSAPAGPEGVAIEQVPDLASADSTAAGAPVGGITCRTASEEDVKYHIHTLVRIYVDGKQVRIPAGAGIAAPRQEEHLANGLYDDNSLHGCLYWIHLHANDGVVHVESPYKGTFTLGQFFDVWQQPLSATQVGPATGAVIAYENGKRLTGDPRSIPLLDHGVIQLDVGSPAVAFQPEQFRVTGGCGAGTAGCANG
jgi:hypothetical protein